MPLGRWGSSMAEPSPFNTTPFLDILTEEQRARVATRSLGDRRPSYFSAALVDAQRRLQQTGDSEASSTDGMVQISLDLEAVLILMPANIKRRLLDFIGQALAVSSSSDELALLTDMVATRQGGYATITHPNVSSALISFEDLRAAFLRFVTLVRGETTADVDPLSVVVPDLNGLFAALRADFDVYSRPDALAVHDVLVDAATVNSYSEYGLDHISELLSWTRVLNVYNV